MSMRGPGDEEKAADAARRPGDQPLQAGTSFSVPSMDCSTPLSRPVSPLTSLLVCREVAPRILEHEKALLVIKEHDYAKVPDRPELLQLASLCMSEEGNFALLGSGEDNSLPLNGPSNSTRTRKAMKDLLLNCHSDVMRHRESLLNRKQDENSLSSHFREVVSLQVALIREQQEQLYEKDKELSTVRKEKEQVGSLIPSRLFGGISLLFLDRILLLMIQLTIDKLFLGLVLIHSPFRFMCKLVKWRACMVSKVTLCVKPG